MREAEAKPPTPTGGQDQQGTFQPDGEDQDNLVLTYIIVGENGYVCTESMKDAFLDRPSRFSLRSRTGKLHPPQTGRFLG